LHPIDDAQNAVTMFVLLLPHILILSYQRETPYNISMRFPKLRIRCYAVLDRSPSIRGTVFGTSCTNM